MKMLSVLFISYRAMAITPISSYHDKDGMTRLVQSGSYRMAIFAVVEPVVTI